MALIQALALDPLPGYDSWKLATPPAYEITPEEEMHASDQRDLDAVVHALVIEDSHTTPTEAVEALYIEIARLRVDALRLNWLEEQAKKSQTGISFDYVPSVDGEPSGFRFMRRHWIGDAKSSLRSAIDAASRASEPKF